MHIAGQPVELGHNDRSLALPGRLQCREQLGALIVATRFRLGERLQETEALSLGKLRQGGLLRLEAKTGPALGRRDPDIGDCVPHVLLPHNASANDARLSPPAKAALDSGQVAAPLMPLPGSALARCHPPGGRFGLVAGYVLPSLPTRVVPAFEGTARRARRTELYGPCCNN